MTYKTPELGFNYTAIFFIIEFNPGPRSTLADDNNPFCVYLPSRQIKHSMGNPGRADPNTICIHVGLGSGSVYLPTT